jgi:hypothetical protein
MCLAYISMYITQILLKVMNGSKETSSFLFYIMTCLQIYHVYFNLQLNYSGKIILILP